MCWSRDVALVTLVFQVGCVALVLSRRGAHPAAWLVPLLITIAIVEGAEALLWPVVSDPVGSAASAGYTCSTEMNGWLTRLIYVAVTAQPLCVNLAAFKSGDAMNRQRFSLPVVLSAVYWTAALASLVAGEVFGARAVNFGETGLKDFRAAVTCAQHGVHGHMHWLFRTSAHYIAPSAFTYLLLFACGLFARPFCVVGVPVAIALSLFTWFLLKFRTSFEAGSTWCWSAVITSSYMVFALPYVASSSAPKEEKGKVL